MSALILTASLFCLGVIGQTEATRRLTFDDSIDLSRQHPGHVGLGAALDARQAEDREISAMSADPTLSLSPAYRLSPSASRGVELDFQVAQSWSLAGLGRLRQTAAAKERSALTGQVRADALARRIGAARAWIQLRVQEEDQRRVARELEVALALTHKLEAAVEAGAVLRADLAEARAYTAEIREGQLDAEGGRVHAQLDLAEALGLSPPIVLVTQGPWPQPKLPDSGLWPGLVERAAELPSARQAMLTHLAAKAQADEANAAGGWWLNTRAGFTKESPTSHIVSVGLGVTLPVFDGARRDRAKAAAQLAQAKAQARAATQSAGRALAMALHEVEHERERLVVAKTELLPALQELVELRTISFERGEGMILEMFRAKQRLLEAEHLLNQIEGEVRWVEVKAWLLLASMQDGAGPQREGEGAR